MLRTPLIRLSAARPAARTLPAARLAVRTYAERIDPQGQPEPPLPPPPKEGGSSKTLMIVAVAAAVAGAAFIPWYKSEREMNADTQRIIRERELAGDEARAKLAIARRDA